MNIQNRGFATAVPILSDEEIEAQVFRKLEAAQRAARERDRENEGFIVLQYPDDRTVFQRLRAWCHMRQVYAKKTAEEQGLAAKPEPVWPRYWAAMKYL